MSLEKVRSYLRRFDKENEILEFDVSSATVELAAKALSTEFGRIAKTLSFKVQGKAILIVMAGDRKIDNKKYKEKFNEKARMLNVSEVNELVGHDIGGVCPFGVKDEVLIYFDESLKNFDYVYPACGSSNSAIKITWQELEKIVQPKGWINVCRIQES